MACLSYLVYKLRHEEQIITTIGTRSIFVHSDHFSTNNINNL